jgi:hypothetical protein
MSIKENGVGIAAKGAAENARTRISSRLLSVPHSRQICRDANDKLYRIDTITNCELLIINC